MFAVNASAARVASSARARASPARGRHISSFGSVRTAPAPSRGAALRLRAAKNNPNFDPNDPMTWGTPAEGSDEAFFEEFAAPVEDLMQLSDEQLGQLLGAEGATVPVMLDDASAAAGSEDDVANPSVAIDLPPRTPPRPSIKVSPCTRTATTPKRSRRSRRRWTSRLRPRAVQKGA